MPSVTLTALQSTDPQFAGGPLAVPWTRRLDGRVLAVRRARPADLSALATMLARCSGATRLTAFGRGGGGWSLAEQERWLRADGHVVVQSGRHRVCAVAGLDDPPAGGHGGPSALVLVEDAWQGRGLGTALVRHLAACAVLGGRRVLGSAAGTDPAVAARLLGRVGELWPAAGDVRVTVGDRAVPWWGPMDDVRLG